MSEDPTRVSFPKLNDGNHGTWQIMMEAHLTSKDLFLDIVEVSVDAVDSSGVPHNQSDIDAELEKKMKKRSVVKMAQARAEMIMRVEPSQLSHMHDNDPLVVWQDLKTVHQARGFGMTLAHRKKLVTMKMRKGQTMVSWIGEVKEHAFNMSESGIDVSEHDQILAVTMGLPPAYKSIITGFNSVSPSSLTLDYVTTQLLNEEINPLSSNGHSEPTHHPNDTSLAAMSAAPVTKMRCYICDSLGHLRRNCPHAAAFQQWKETHTITPISQANAVFDESPIEGDDFAY